MDDWGGSLEGVTERQQKFETREEWLVARREGIGGSDASAVLGVSRWKGPLGVYVEKLGIAAEEKENRFTKWGRMLEGAVATAYEEETGRKLWDTGALTITRHAKIPYLFATLDRLVLHPERGTGVLQIKTTSWGFLEEWRQEPPLEAQVQLQHEMAVAGVEWGSLAVLVAGREFRWVDVEINRDFIQAMVEAEGKFWKMVEGHEPPPPDRLEETGKALRALYPRDSGETIALPDEALVWHGDLVEAKAKVKEWEAKKVEGENKIKAAMGGATFGVLINGSRYSWKTSERKGYAVEPTTSRPLRFLEK
jgi:putative phage-type endonuclease